MILKNCIIVLIVTASLIATAPTIDVVFIIQGQDSRYHNELSEKLRKNIIKQSKELQPNYRIRVHLLHEIFNYPGGWTIHNLIPQLMSFHRKQHTDIATNKHIDKDMHGNVGVEIINDHTRWIVFCEDSTKVKVKLLMERLNNENHMQALYLGYPLHDREPTIVHHFAFFENPKWFPYPMLSAGIVFSLPLVKSIADIYTNQNNKLFKQQFSIDAGHELARFIYDNVHVPLMTSTTWPYKSQHVNTLSQTSSHATTNLLYKSSSSLATTTGEGNVSKRTTTTTKEHPSKTVDTTNISHMPLSDFRTLTADEVKGKHGNEIFKPGDNKNTTTKTSIIKKQKIILKKASYICPTATWESSCSRSNMNNDNESCAMYAEQKLNPTSAMTCIRARREEIYFAVKTCSKYHKERLPIIQATWANHAKHIKYFSDTPDDTIPTTLTGVPNVEMGHCAKTLQILKLALRDIENYNEKQQHLFHANQVEYENHQIKWLFISDDDTLLSVSGVCQVLGCYNSMDEIYLGERYGYRLFAQDGFNYITGGGGIAFSLPVVKIILQHCSCPSATAPDDMILGSCLHSLQLKALHSPRFHQARPNDYPLELLQQEPPVSFHKFWQLDPFEVYNQWFAAQDEKFFGVNKMQSKNLHKDGNHLKTRKLLVREESLNLNKIPVSMMASVHHSKERHVEL